MARCVTVVCHRGVLRCSTPEWEANARQGHCGETTRARRGGRPQPCVGQPRVVRFEPDGRGDVGERGGGVPRPLRGLPPLLTYYLSISRRFKDCSWYAQCSLERLEQRDGTAAGPTQTRSARAVQ